MLQYLDKKWIIVKQSSVLHAKRTRPIVRQVDCPFE